MKTVKPVPVAGYSGTPLVKKLGIRERARLRFENAPAGFVDLVGALPAGATLCRSNAPADHVHLFVTERATLAARLAAVRRELASDATLWISWPKRASKVETDVTEDVIRALALPLGFVDVKVCAIDATWSGLKLVVRKSLR